MFFTIQDLIIYSALFLISIAYAIGLQVWQRHFPQSFDELTWLQVVVGVGYVLIALGWVVSFPEVWLRVCVAFFVACLPIVFRSLFLSAQNQRDAEEME